MNNSVELSEFSSVKDKKKSKPTSLISALLWSTNHDKIVGLSAIGPFLNDDGDGEAKVGDSDDCKATLLSKHPDQASSVANALAVFKIPEACNPAIRFAEFWIKSQKIAEPLSIVGKKVVAEGIYGTTVVISIKFVNYALEYAHRNGSRYIYREAIKGKLIDAYKPSDLIVGARVRLRESLVGFIMHLEEDGHVLIVPFSSVLSTHGLRIASREEVNSKFPTLRLELGNSLPGFNEYIDSDADHKERINNRKNAALPFPKPAPFHEHGG